MSMQAAIGCGGVGCVVGAEALSETAGVWVKTRFYRDGNFLCATVYSVAAGEPKIVELRVDLRPIARAIMRAHTALHEKEGNRAVVRGQPLVGWNLGKLWKGAKKAASKIGRMKLVKGVVGVTKAIAKGAKAVVKSKAFGVVLGVAAVFPLTAAFAAPALGAYAAANAAVASVEAGAKVVTTARTAANTITQGKKLARQVASTKATANAIVSKAGARIPSKEKAALAARAQAAGKLSLNAAGKATVVATLAQAPSAAARAKVAASMASRLKALSALRSRAVLANGLPPAASSAILSTTKLELSAAPVIAAAAATAKKLEDPTVRAQLVDIRARATKAEALLSNVKSGAATGNLDSQKSAVIVNLVARNRARIQAMSQANAGGLPGILITQEGRITRGKFRVQASAAATGLLYQGPTQPRQSGAFTSVSGWPWRAHRVGKSYRGGCYAINGDLPIDGVRLMAPGPAAFDIGPYEVGRGNSSSDVRSPTSTRTEVRSPTRTEVRSPTRTATEVRSPTSTSTDAYTQGNFTATVTGGAGAGANTTVHIHAAPQPYTLDSRGDKQLAKTAMDVDTTAPTADRVQAYDSSDENEDFEIGSGSAGGCSCHD